MVRSDGRRTNQELHVQLWRARLVRERLRGDNDACPRTFRWDLLRFRSFDADAAEVNSEAQNSGER